VAHAQHEAAGRVVAAARVVGRGSGSGGLLPGVTQPVNARNLQVGLFVLWPHRMQLAGGRGADGSCPLPLPNQGAAAACAATAARPACIALHSTHSRRYCCQQHCIRFKIRICCNSATAAACLPGVLLLLPPPPGPAAAVGSGCGEAGCCPRQVRCMWRAIALQVATRLC
jgi:hypothetical protein